MKKNPRLEAPFKLFPTGEVKEFTPEEEKAYKEELHKLIEFYEKGNKSDGKRLLFTPLYFKGFLLVNNPHVSKLNE